MNALWEAVVLECVFSSQTERGVISLIHYPSLHCVWLNLTSGGLLLICWMWNINSGSVTPHPPPPTPAQGTRVNTKMMLPHTESAFCVCVCSYDVRELSVRHDIYYCKYTPYSEFHFWVCKYVTEKQNEVECLMAGFFFKNLFEVKPLEMHFQAGPQTQYHGN